MRGLAGSSWRRRALAGIGAGVGAALGALARAAASPARLRPPGAAREREFLAACVRCGQCVQACPHHTLRLEPAQNGRSAGAPYMASARTAPCRLCPDEPTLRCIEACPTGALAPVADPREIRMGVASIDPRICLAHQGVVCRTCWHACPYPDEAITLCGRLRPHVVADRCIGCGLCELACPTEPSAIVVRPFGEAASPSAERSDAGGLGSGGRGPGGGR